MANFKAKPLRYLSSHFVPKKSIKPLTEIEEFDFNINKRLVKRHDFDTEQNKKRKAKEIEELNKVEELKVLFSFILFSSFLSRLLA